MGRRALKRSLVFRTWKGFKLLLQSPFPKVLWIPATTKHNCLSQTCLNYFYDGCTYKHLILIAICCFIQIDFYFNPSSKNSLQNCIFLYLKIHIFLYLYNLIWPMPFLHNNVCVWICTYICYTLYCVYLVCIYYVCVYVFFCKLLMACLALQSENEENVIAFYMERLEIE